MTESRMMVFNVNILFEDAKPDVLYLIRRVNRGEPGAPPVTFIAVHLRSTRVDMVLHTVRETRIGQHQASKLFSAKE